MPASFCCRYLGRSEVEKLKIGKRLRSKTGSAFYLSSMNNSNLIRKVNMPSSSTLLLNATTIGYAVLADTEKKQQEEKGGGGREIEGLADWNRLLSSIKECDYDDENPYEILLI